MSSTVVDGCDGSTIWTLQQFTDSINSYGLAVGRTVGPCPATPASVTPSVIAADNDNAGWGFMVLNNFLPNQGNGTFDLHAYAIDGAGLQTLLGTRRIVAANSTSIKPFGTIDTPGQGETVTALALDGFFGFPPAMAALLPAYQSGQLLVVHATGSTTATAT